MGSEPNTRLEISGVELCTEKQGGAVTGIRIEAATISLKNYNVTEFKLLP